MAHVENDEHTAKESKPAAKNKKLKVALAVILIIVIIGALTGAVVGIILVANKNGGKETSTSNANATTAAGITTTTTLSTQAPPIDSSTMKQNDSTNIRVLVAHFTIFKSKQI